VINPRGGRGTRLALRFTLKKKENGAMKKATVVMEARHLVFVYGSLLAGEHNHARYLDGARFVGGATIAGFTMVSFGGFPAIVAGPHAVRGEIYEVNDEELVALDRLEGTPHFYTRELVTAELDDGALPVHVYKLANEKRAREGRKVEPIDGVLDWRHRRGLRCAS